VPMRQKMVAVVDDGPAMLKSIERLLSARGFRVEVSPSAEAWYRKYHRLRPPG
jgi:FixJ family two-component response regulator